MLVIRTTNIWLIGNPLTDSTRIYSFAGGCPIDANTSRSHPSVIYTCFPKPETWSSLQFYKTSQSSSRSSGEETSRYPRFSEYCDPAGMTWCIVTCFFDHRSLLDKFLINIFCKQRETSGPYFWRDNCLVIWDYSHLIFFKVHLQCKFQKRLTLSWNKLSLSDLHEVNMYNVMIVSTNILLHHHLVSNNITWNDALFRWGTGDNSILSFSMNWSSLRSSISTDLTMVSVGTFGSSAQRGTSELGSYEMLVSAEDPVGSIKIRSDEEKHLINT